MVVSKSTYTFDRPIAAALDGSEADRSATQGQVGRLRREYLTVDTHCLGVVFGRRAKIRLTSDLHCPGANHGHFFATDDIAPDAAQPAARRGALKDLPEILCIFGERLAGALRLTGAPR